MQCILYEVQFGAASVMEARSSCPSTNNAPKSIPSALAKNITVAQEALNSWNVVYQLWTVTVTFSVVQKETASSCFYERLVLMHTP